MSLYGALYSGVSGLTAQSSAMGAISDNITNVSTVGYKNTNNNFKTLVTTQTSTTFYSAGGIQSAPRQAVDVQGLLQASTSQTDIALSGGGFFVVNAQNQPGVNDPYFFTRAGSFKQDSEGFLSNSAGYYLQGWPTDASGNIVPANSTLNQTNLNVISNDYLQTVNLSRVAGSAAATSEISIGANVPATAVQGDSYSTDVEFFDTLGTPGTLNYAYTRTGADNQWDITVKPPSGTAVLTSYDDASLVYDSWGQLEFTARPAEGSTVTIDGKVYEFDPNNDGATGTNIAVDTSGSTTVSGDVAQLLAVIKVNDSDFSTANARASIDANNSTTLLFHENGTDAIVVDPSSLLDSSGNAVTKQTALLTVAKQNAKYSPLEQFTFNGGANPADGNTITINGKVYEFDTAADGVAGANILVDSSAGVLATTLTDLVAKIQANDPYYPVGGTTVIARPANGTAASANDTLVLSSVSGQSFTVSWTGLTLNDAAKTPAARTGPITVDTTAGLVFTDKGVPSSIGVKNVEILGFSSGAANMDGTTANSPRIAMDFDSMAQFGSAFSPEFIQKNGSRFGSFSGVSISPEGQVVALFDNGDTRPVYQLPVATFTNPNGLGSRSGNVWNASEASGDYTLRTAGEGPAGVVTQASLESSTVDIGAEFTNMIVVQRAYSASTKIISTADQMLEELMRVKR